MPRGIAVRNLRKPVSLSVQKINNYGGDPLKHLILSKTKKAKPMWPEDVCCVLTKAKPVPGAALSMPGSQAEKCPDSGSAARRR